MSAAEQFVPGPPVDGEIIGDGPSLGGDPAARDVWIDQALEELAEIEAAIAGTREFTARRVQMIVDAQTEKVASLEARAAPIRAMLHSIARVYPFPGKSKSTRLPFGSFGRKVKAISVTITDPAKALDYAYGCNLPVRVAVETDDPAQAGNLLGLARAHHLTHTQTIGKAALAAHLRDRLAADPAWRPDADETGWSFEGGTDEPWVRPEMPRGAE